FVDTMVAGAPAMSAGGGIAAPHFTVSEYVWPFTSEIAPGASTGPVPGGPDGGTPRAFVAFDARSSATAMATTPAPASAAPPIQSARWVDGLSLPFFIAASGCRESRHDPDLRRGRRRRRAQRPEAEVERAAGDSRRAEAARAKAVVRPEAGRCAAVRVAHRRRDGAGADRRIETSDDRREVRIARAVAEGEARACRDRDHEAARCARVGDGRERGPHRNRVR